MSFLPFAVVGDTQRTDWAERWLLFRRQHDRERAVLLGAIAAQKPSLVMMVGDLVTRGSVGQWCFWDTVTSPLREAGIPIMAARGNHDYRGSRGDAEWERRFGQNRWDVRRHGDAALVWLDSNRRALGAAAWEEQRHWLAAQLAALDRDRSVTAVFCFAHHPPFTNSRIVGDSRDVGTTFVPLVERSRKAVALFTGHHHGYEHFSRAGKHYFVTGGGGGPPSPVRLPPAARHRDLFEGERVRPFHFLLVTDSSDRIEVEARGLAGTIDRVRLV